MIRKLAAKAATPSAFLIMTTVLINVLRIGNTMALTRLLQPRDYGLAGIIFSIFFIVAMVTDAGFQAFVVRHERGDDPRFLDAIWTIHVLRGLALAILIALGASPLAALMAKPAVAPLLAVAAVTFAIDGAVSTSLFTAVRSARVRQLSIIDVIAAVAQIVVGLAAGAILHNAWAMVCSMIAQSLVRTGCSYVLLPDAARRPRRDRALAAELWRFSQVIAASSILTLLIAQTDKLVLARLFTLPEFGVYVIAANLAGAPVALAMLYGSRIVYPHIAQVWRTAPDRVGDAIYQGRGAVFYLYLLGGGGLIGGAPLLIRLLYDPRYLPAGSYLRILAIATAMTLMTRSIVEALVAIGATRMTLLMNIARIGWLVLGGGTGLLLAGPAGLVVALGLIEVPAYLVGMIALARRKLLDRGRELLAVATIGIGTAIGYGIAAAVQYIRPA